MSERRRIIEGTWKCTSCDAAGIPGSQKVCPTCGNPREDEEAKFDFGKKDASGKSDAATVQDADKLALAAAGADWYCANCGTANTGTAVACKSCGTNDAESRLAKKPEKPRQSTPGGTGAPVAAAAEPKKGGGGMLVGLIGCLGIGAIGAVLIVFVLAGVNQFWTSESAGTVTAMQWSREITVETFTPVQGKKGWRTEMPKKASIVPKNGQGGEPGADNVRECTRKEKSPKKCETKTKQVQCGTVEKCEQKDLGNGFAEEVCKDVPKMCDEKYEECKEAVQDDWCTFDTYEWKKGQTYTSNGADAAPKWPDAPALGAMDRHVKAEKYALTVSYEGETATYEPKDEKEFAQFAPNQSVVVEVGAFGGVQGVSPKK
jgi:hypothetical protein